ncbi:MAG: hypothetical protein MUE73_02265 [Planctomycetes bacterium]|nr:hypothetical protein [Planctomycetota bacterium]
MAIPKSKAQQAKREDEAHAAVVSLHHGKRTHEIQLARLFSTIDRSVAFAYFACGSIGEYGARFGYSPEEARNLAAVGAALEVVPEIEVRLLDGRLTFDAAAAIAGIILRPDFAERRGEWMNLAGNSDLAQLRRKVRKALAEAERKEVVVPKTVHLTEQDEKDFFDARGRISRAEGRILSEGETIGWLSRVYLDRADPLRAEPGQRRVPDTRFVDSRYVPIEVRREVFARTGGKCAVWDCENRWFIDLAHLFPHSEGGHREASGLTPLCGMHHDEFDHGLLFIEGTADRPIFKDAAGNLLPGGPDATDTG